MGSVSDQTPLVVVVGETASGKSAMAMELARQFNGEIICADSRTVYTGMDIGTAKPNAKDQAKIPHHLLNIVMPDENFTAADFKRLANDEIEEISEHGKVPIMVGGTGLYIDSVLYDYQFSEPGAERDKLNPRHLKESENHDRTMRANTLIIGIETDREALKVRIAERVGTMFREGLEAEARSLAEQYGWQAPGLQTIGYQEFENEQTTEQTKEQIVKATIAYAKRQRTWFKRNKSIHWVRDFTQAKNLVQNFLSKAV